MMTPELFKRVFSELNIVLPYGKSPGERPDGTFKDINTRELYEALSYNPPHYFPEYTQPDENASPKPPWDDIEIIGYIILQDDALIATIDAFKRECELRITAAYGAKSYTQEIQLRLRGAHTPEQDARRDWLLVVYEEFKDNVYNMNLEQLQALDPKDDKLWR